VHNPNRGKAAEAGALREEKDVQGAAV